MRFSAIRVLVTASVLRKPGRLVATAVAIGFAGTLLLAALVGRQMLVAAAAREPRPVLAENELHLAASDPVYPWLDPQLVREIRADPRVADSEAGVVVRVIDLPGREDGTLDEAAFYDGEGMNGWIPGRSAELMAWEKDGPPLDVKQGRLPASAALDPIEVSVPQNQMWNATFEGYRRLESDTGPHAALVVGVTNGTVRSAPDDFRLATRRVSPAAARVLAGVDRPPSNIRIRLHNSAEKAAFVEQWRRQLAETGSKARLWDEEMTGEDGRRGSRRLDSARSAVLTAVLLAGACVICIAFGVQGSAVRERTAQYVLLRSLGADRLLLFSVVLAEAAVLGAAGLLGAVGLAWASLAGVSAYAPFLNMRSAPDAASIASTGAVILAGVLLGSAWPAAIAAQARPSQTARMVDTQQRWRRALIAAVAGILLAAVGAGLVSLSPSGATSRARLLTWVAVPAVTMLTILLTPLLVQLTSALFTRPVAWLTQTDSLILGDQLAGDEARSAGSVVAIAVGLGGFFWVLCWGASMLNSFMIDTRIPRWLASIHPHGITRQETEQLLASPALAGMHPLTLVDTRMGKTAGNEDPADETTPALVMGVEVRRVLGDSADALPFRFLAGSRSDAVTALTEDGACLISDWYAASNRVSVGDVLPITVPGASSAEVRYRVAGIVDLRGWRMATKQNKVRRNINSHEVLIVAAADVVRRDFPVAHANYLLGNSLPDTQGQVARFRGDLPSDRAYEISRQERTDLEAAIGSAVDLTAKLEYRPHGEATVTALRRSVQVDDLDRTRSALWGDWGGAAVKKMGWVPLCILAISLLSVTGALVASLRSRARELGVLRSCGLTRNGLLRLAVAESLLVGLAAIPVSAIFGCGGAWIMLRVAEIVGFHLRFTGINPEFVIPWAWLWPGLLLTAAICGLAAVWCGWKINRLSPSLLLSGARGGN